MLAKRRRSWTVLSAAPPREVFASMEQMIGTPPFRFEVEAGDRARAVEVERNGFFGQWKTPKHGIHWVTCSATVIDAGTLLHIESSGGAGALSRAHQLVHLFTAGNHDQRTIYRRRDIPPGPVSLVASWAGMPYPLFSEPRFDAPRGREILTATHLLAVPGGNATFCKVRLDDGTEGYIEKDQIVAAPEEATREAQLEAARHV